jgi:hypothetical protein
MVNFAFGYSAVVVAGDVAVGADDSGVAVGGSTSSVVIGVGVTIAVGAGLLHSASAIVAWAEICWSGATSSDLW